MIETLFALRFAHLRTCLDVGDIEHFVRTRYNRDEKKSKKWVKKYAVSLYAEIDADEGGGISYEEFKEFCEINDTMLMYGFWLQSQLRKVAFGEEYWRKATETRPNAYKLDVSFLYKLMGDMTWDQIWAMGFAPEDSMVPRKDDCPKFQTDFYDAYYKMKERKMLEKQKTKKRSVVTSTLAAMTHKRCIDIFSRIVPDVMTIGHAFGRWKDVHAYGKSMDMDGGDMYRAQNMSLMDIKLASTAMSVGKSTRKLEIALLGDFEAEATVVEDKGRRRKTIKKAKEMADKKRITEEVLREIACSQPTDADVVNEVLNANRLTLHGVNRLPKLGIRDGKFERIKRGPALRAIKNVLPEVKKRRVLREGIEKHFEDIRKEREKENNRATLDFEEGQTQEFENSALRRRVTDRFGETIEGGFELVGMTSLKALESVRMLSGMGSSGGGYQRGRREMGKRGGSKLPR